MGREAMGREGVARALESDAPEATEALAAELGRRLAAGDVVALTGELGSGKTCFVRGLARGLGVEDAVTSPTYVLHQSYTGRIALQHFDAYFEGRERAFLTDGGAEWLSAGGVSAVEWSDRVQELLPDPRIEVALEHLASDRRRIALGVAGGGARAERLRRILAELALPPGIREQRSAGRA